MFSGMMFCADCGSVMYQCRAANFRRKQEYYLCTGYRRAVTSAVRLIPSAR